MSGKCIGHLHLDLLAGLVSLDGGGGGGVLGEREAVSKAGSLLGQL